MIYEFLLYVLHQFDIQVLKNKKSFLINSNVFFHTIANKTLKTKSNYF